MGRFLNPKALRAKSEAKARGTPLPEDASNTRREGVPAGSGDPTLSGQALVGAKRRGLSKNDGPEGPRFANPSAPSRTRWQQLPVQPSAHAAAAVISAALAPRQGLVTLGNIAFFLYLISPELNDLSHHFFGVNAYVSWLAPILIAIALLTSGSGLRAWNLTVGKLWIALVVLMIASIPFSEWPDHSFRSVLEYFMRSTLIFFAACAFVVDVRTLKTAILAEVVNGFLLLIACMTMGGTVSGGDRFYLVGSYFYGGANDLALALTVAAGFFLYWSIERNFFKAAFGVVSLLASIYFLMRTGSRGGFLALAVLLIASLIFSARYRWRIIPILLLAPVLTFFVPNSMTHRLGYVALDSSKARATTADEGASLQSQQEREYMFWRSVGLMVTHPLVGVGMDCFMVTLYREDLQKHEHTASLGTHNSYTQIGCECGIPALLVYLSILRISMRQTYRLFRESSGKRGLEVFPALALCMFSILIGLSVAMFFYHSAYSGTVPVLTGLMAGLNQAFQHEQALLAAPAGA